MQLQATMEGEISLVAKDDLTQEEGEEEKEDQTRQYFALICTQLSMTLKSTVMRSNYSGNNMYCAAAG
jgi:hypothetical protein